MSKKLPGPRCRRATPEGPPQEPSCEVEGTWLEDCLLTLHDELAEHGLTVRPHAWISNEWFSPRTAGHRHAVLSRPPGYCGWKRK